MRLSELQIPPPGGAKKFEHLCCDLYKAEFGDQTQLYGREGQIQNGVDIFVQDKHIGIQCKKIELYKNNTQNRIKKILHTEVEKAKYFQPPLKRFILAITCKRDARIQEEANLITKRHEKENIFSVEIHSWEEIQKLLEEYPKVYEKYYGSLVKGSTSSITRATVSSIQQDSRHQELNRIKNLIHNKQPRTAFGLLASFKKEKWGTLEDKEKYRVLTNMGFAKIEMRNEEEGFKFLIEAYPHNKNDADAHINYAFAFLLSKNDIITAKKHIEEAKRINPHNERLCELTILLADAEGKNFNDIVQSLPEEIKDQTEIAFCLSQIALKQKMKLEAKRWAKIAYDSTQKNDHSISSHYACMILHSIPSKDDFFKKSKEIYQEDISTAVDIYQTLISEQGKYVEINKYHPEWYNNLALALEYSGDIDRAIEIMRTAVNKWPEDINLKLYLAEVFTKTKKFEESISILKNVQNDSKTPLSAKLFLSENLFLNGSHDESFEVLDSIIRLKNIDASMYLEVIRLKILRFVGLKKYEEAEKSLHLFKKKNLENEVALILESKIRLEEGKEKEAKHLAIEAKNDITEKTHIQDLKLLVRLMYKMTLYEHCESLLEDIVDQNLDHPDIFTLLHVYFENGKNNKAIDLAKKILKKYPDRIEPVHTLFLIYRSLGDIDRSIRYYEKFLKLNPRNQLVQIDLSLAYIQNEHIDKAKNILENITFNLDQLQAEKINGLSFAYMQIGNIEKALETQYKCLKIYPNKLSSHSVYFELMTFLNRMNLQNTSNGKQNTNKNKFLNPKVICEDCFVQIQDIETLRKSEIIIEQDAETYIPGHELSKALIGRKIGDEVTVGSSKKYKIIEVISKYIHRYREIANKSEQKFTSKTFLKSILIDKTGDRKKELSKNILKKIPHAFKQQENSEQLFKYYNEGKVTIGLIAQMLRKHPIDIIGRLIHYSSKYKFISAVPQWENHKNVQKCLNDLKGILLDISSLMTIHQIGIEKNIEESELKLYICQSTIDSLKNYIQELRLYSQDGLLTIAFNKEGDLRKHYTSAKDIKENLNFWMKVKVWAEKSCQIKSISTNVVLSQKKRKEEEKLLGKEFFDSILACDDTIILLCEDAILRKYAEEKFSKSGVRLFDLIEHFERYVTIDNDQAMQFKAQLVKLNQTYISIDHKILMFLIKEAEYSIDDIGFQRGLFFLSNVSELSGVISIVANFFMEIYQEPSLLPHNRQIIMIELLNQISVGREENSERIAYQIIQCVQIRTQFLPLLQNDICKDIMDWLKNKIG